MLDGSLLNQTHYLTWTNNTGTDVKITVTLVNKKYSSSSTNGSAVSLRIGTTVDFSTAAKLTANGGSSWVTKEGTYTVKAGYKAYFENQSNASSYITVEIIEE